MTVGSAGAVGFSYATTRLHDAGVQIERTTIEALSPDDDGLPAKADPVRRVERYDLEQSIVDMQQAQATAKANLGSLKSEKEQYESLVDLITRQGYPLR